jgi:hypothetical protein
MITKEDFDLAQSIIDGRVRPVKRNHVFLYTNLIRCADCGASITAEKKIKHQKNGNIHKYTYYRCTKRVDLKCKQKSIREEDLEKQIFSILERIEIPDSFHQWAMKHLKEEHKKEQTDRDEIIDSYQKSFKRCVAKIDNLLNMRLNEEISFDEYVIKKEELLKDKRKYEELISDSSKRVETWLDRAETLFSFAETAKNRFENGSFETKRQILSSLGSNLLLEDKKLMISADINLAILKSLAPEVRELHARLEPIKTQSSQGSWEEKYTQNEKMVGWTRLEPV